MTGADDRLGGMDAPAGFDAAVEEAAAGLGVGDDLAGLAGLARFVADVRLAASGPPPPRSPQLEALLLSRRLAPATRPAAVASPAPIAEPAGRRPGSVAPNGTGPAARRRRPARRWAAGSLAGKVALVAGLAGAGTAAAGAAGVLPEPVAGVVRRVVELATPFELPADPVPTVSDPSGDAAGGVGSGLAASAPAPAGPPVAVSAGGAGRESAGGAADVGQVALSAGGAGWESAGGAADVGQVAGAEVIGEVESGGSLPADPAPTVGGPSPAPAPDASAPPTTAPPPPGPRPGSPLGDAAGPPAPAPGERPAPGPASSPAPPAGSACDGNGRCEPVPVPLETAPAQPSTSTSPGPAGGYPSVTYHGDDDAHDLDASSGDGQHGWS